jgi:hypothetical protein
MTPVLTTCCAEGTIALFPQPIVGCFQYAQPFAGKKKIVDEYVRRYIFFDLQSKALFHTRPFGHSTPHYSSLLFAAMLPKEFQTRQRTYLAVPLACAVLE